MLFDSVKYGPVDDKHPDAHNSKESGELSLTNVMANGKNPVSFSMLATLLHPVSTGNFKFILLLNLNF